MELQLSQRNLDYIVQQQRLALRKDIKAMIADTRQPELVSTKVAAAIIGITPQRLRQIVCEDPNRYPHIKRGNTKQSKLMFDRKALIKIINGMC